MMNVNLLTPLLVALGAVLLVTASSGVKADNDLEGQYIKEKFSNGFKFGTYAEFETFFQQKLPQYNQDIRLDLKNPDLALVGSPLYDYASNELNIEPVTQLYQSYNRDMMDTKNAMLNIEKLWRNGDENFKLLTKSTVTGLLRAIVWNHLRGLTEKLLPVVSSESIDYHFSDKLMQQQQQQGQFKLLPQVERLQTEMCQLLSEGQYNRLAVKVPDSKWFDCEDPEELRQFLAQIETNPRAVMAKISKYAIASYKRKQASSSSAALNNPAATPTREALEREQPHRVFAKALKQQLEPIFGVLDTAMRMMKPSPDDDITSANDYQLLKEKVDSRLSGDKKNSLVEYWHLVYEVCKLINSIKFGRPQSSQQSSSGQLSQSGSSRSPLASP